MLLSTQLFDRIVGMSAAPAGDLERKATVLPVGCRRAVERRAATRLAYGHRTQICRDSGKQAGVWDTVMLQDISVKGIGYLCDTPMQAGETFVLKLTDTEGEHIRIRCKVARCERGGFGNTAFLLGATYEHVIQQQALRVNDDEDWDQPTWQNQIPAESEAANVGDPGGLRSAGAAVARAAVSWLRAVDLSTWRKRSDDFSSVG